MRYHYNLSIESLFSTLDIKITNAFVKRKSLYYYRTNLTQVECLMYFSLRNNLKVNRFYNNTKHATNQVNLIQINFFNTKEKSFSIQIQYKKRREGIKY